MSEGKDECESSLTVIVFFGASFGRERICLVQGATISSIIIYVMTFFEVGLVVLIRLIGIWSHRAGYLALR